MSPAADLAKEYADLKFKAKLDLAHPSVAHCLAQMGRDSFKFLNSECQQVPLKSLVADKDYFSYRLTPRISRPINAGLFLSNPTDAFEGLAEARLGFLSTLDATKALYTLAMSFCAANDTIKTGDKKTPATFFEILIGHIFSVGLGVLPRKQVKLSDPPITLPNGFHL